MKNEASRYSTAFILTVKFSLFMLLMSVLCLVMGGIALLFSSPYEDRFTLAEPKTVRIVIDAGHGGEDGGAVGVDGTLEKDVNLKVATLVQDMLSASGVSSVMTRTDDVMLYDLYGELSDYKGKKKLYDLKNRLRFAEEREEAVFVSIHMNSFGVSKYSGLQIYFSPNSGESHLLAETVRAAAVAYLQPENKRESKPAGSAIYILHRISRPAILVECGFLSNHDECSLLGTDAYQRRLALVISSALAEYISASDREGAPIVN